MDAMSISDVNVATEPEPRRGRGRRPAVEVREDALEAAASLLFEQGISAVTFERVSSAARVSKTTLYKWWPTPAVLAAEAYFARVQHVLEFPDTGSIQADLRTQLHSFANLMMEDRAGAVIAELIGYAQIDPALRSALATGYGLPRREEAVRRLEVAQQHGQIRAGLPLDILVDQLWGACYHRLLVLNEPITSELCDLLIDNAFHGAAPRSTHDRSGDQADAAARPR
jgi:AcrR family transcriptional regulator